MHNYEFSINGKSIEIRTSAAGDVRNGGQFQVDFEVAITRVTSAIPILLVSPGQGTNGAACEDQHTSSSPWTFEEIDK
jgi:hypothetical protein